MLKSPKKHRGSFIFNLKIERSLTFQYVFKSLHWETKGINIQSSYLSNLRFSYDIILWSSNSEELRNILKESNTASENIGLNISKTKVITKNDEHTNMFTVGIKMKNVDEYLYLVYTIKWQKKQDSGDKGRI